MSNLRSQEDPVRSNDCHHNLPLPQPPCDLEVQERAESDQVEEQPANDGYVEDELASKLSDTLPTIVSSVRHYLCLKDLASDVTEADLGVLFSRFGGRAVRV
jgi:hypothetical protein